MSETEQAKPVKMPEGEITFEGRTMRVQMPQPEQIVVWKRIMKRLETSNVKSWDGKQVLDALERLRTIIDTVLLDEADVDWLDDEMLAGRIKLVGASNILLEATAAFSNRAGRRAAAKKVAAAPARRKAPAKKTAAKKTTRKRAAS